MAFTVVTPAERIRQLSAHDEETAAILQHAGQALKALSPDAGDDGSDVDARKSQFEESAKAVFTSIQSLTAQLRRQAYALEEAGIIAAEAPTLSSGAQQRQQPPNTVPGRGGPAAAPQTEAERITNSGLGNLDVGWLNSRGNKVGAEKEAELMAEAKELAQKTLQEKRDAT
ncbi:hypothetical protein LTR36_007689 [Oleoguttula mirabilis]|uniref:Mediator of RNA polymerase II transcription subunit 11 n=1 Tax=Oleoguttula mirabilis TaxID=1507867 RepID=A0AAV9JVZ5_9PEZI|nr:hypothetical protein LTR36_007689 [Oleoguttula mirabilis]